MAACSNITHSILACLSTRRWRSSTRPSAPIPLKVEKNGTVKLFRDQGLAPLNGFFPVFVGRFATDGDSTELRGGFRFHLLAIGLFCAFVMASLLSLTNLLLSPDVVAGLPEGWKFQRIRFELQFIGFAVLAAVFAWLAGKPMRERIASIIESSSK